MADIDPAAAADGGFYSAFVNSLGMIFATEIGDKTFFIAAILAMQYSRLVVFGGGISALVVMTVLSTILGYALPQLLPKWLTHWLSIFLFVYFGAKMLWEARQMYITGEGTGVSDELEEVEQELAAKGLAAECPGDGVPSPKIGAEGAEHELEGLTGREATEGSFENSGGGDQRAPSTPTKKAQVAEVAHMSEWAVLAQAFTLTFLAEWGDRSQIATIALASAQNPFGVTLGACVGHSFCTGMAVVGGKLLAEKITERQVATSGGILFFVFAFYSWWVGPS